MDQNVKDPISGGSAGVTWSSVKLYARLDMKRI